MREMIDSIKASIVYQGEKRFIQAGVTEYEKGLQAEYEFCQKEPDAYYAVLKLRNIGDENSGRIQLPKSLDLFIPAEKRVIYHGLTGDSCGEKSFLPVDFAVEKDYHEEPLGGRSSNTTGFPFFDLTSEEGALAVAIGWSGQWSKDILAEENGIRIQIGLCFADFYLKPGEEVRLPSVLVVQAEDGPSSRRRMREVLRKHFSPASRLGEDMTLPVSIQCFDRYFWGKVTTDKCEKWASEAGQKITADEAAKTGNFDTLWLDAAWFAEGFPHGVGNYRFDEGFPDGLKPVSDHVHKKGMKFLVWFEPERIYEGSDLFPRDEYLLASRVNEKEKLFNLANDEACSFLEETLISMIKDNGIDMYRQDFNMDPLPYWLENDEKDRTGITEMKYVVGLYRVWDKLIETFPGILIDNCSSGGRRLDLETLSRAVSLWRSDTGCFPESEDKRTNTWSQNQILTLTEYLPFHSCAVWDSDAYTMRSNSTHGVACNFDVLNTSFDMDRAGKALDEVQELKSYWNGTFYPLAEVDVSENGWCTWQLAKPAARQLAKQATRQLAAQTTRELSGEAEGIVYVFRRENSEESRKVICLREMESTGTYQLTFIREDYSREQMLVSGEELMKGLEIILNEKRSSLVIKYKRV